MNRIQVALFILRDMYRMDRFRVLAIGPLGLVAETSRMLGAGLLLQFIGGYASGEGGPQLDVFGIDLGFDADASRAWLWLGLIALTAALASGLDYAYIFAQLRIGRRFAYQAAEYALTALRDQPHSPRRATDTGGFVRGSGSILGSISPTIQALVFWTLMFWMRPGLSVVMAIVGLVFLGPLTIALGNRVLGATRRKQATSKHTPQGADVAMLSSGPLYADSLRNDAYERSMADGDTIESYEAVFSVRANQMLARAAGAAFLGIGAVVLAVGLTIAEEPGVSDVGALLAYAIVAQFGFRAVATIGLNAVQFNRFFPTYESYVEMRTGNEADAAPPINPVHTGEIWVVTQRRTPEPWVLPDWLEAIGVDPTTRTGIALGADDLPNSRVRELLGGGFVDDETRQTCEDFMTTALGRPLRERELEGRVDDLSGGGGTPVAKRSAIALSAIVTHTDPLLVICPAKLLTNLKRGRQRDVLDALGRHHVVIVGRARTELLEMADRIIDGDDIPSFEHPDEEDDAA
ncbi:MAG: hypothetical protein ACR2QE_12275 [Acidimicrobiales bacterium]